MTSAKRDAVLLDVDGTLIDSTYHHALAWFRACRDEDLEVELWRVHRSIGMGGDHIVEHLFDAGVEKRSGDRLRDGWQRHYEELADDVRPLAGAAELVRGLRQQGLAVALASSSPEELTDRAIELLGLTKDDFDAITTSADAERAKPAPDILQVAMERCGAERAVLVGDSVWDCEAAKRTGIPVVTVRTGGFGEDELTGAGAALVADTVADLGDVDWRGLLERAG